MHLTTEAGDPVAPVLFEEDSLGLAPNIVLPEPLPDEDDSGDDPLRTYLREIHEVNLLTAADERLREKSGAKVLLAGPSKIGKTGLLRTLPHPDRVLLDFSGQFYTYGDVDRLSTRMAHALAELNVRAGETVVTMLDNNVDAVISWLAINKLCAISVPVSGEIGPEEAAAGALTPRPPRKRRPRRPRGTGRRRRRRSGGRRRR